MTSKLVVNTIEADTGISSVSFASSISMSSTSKFHFGDAGIDIGADTNINRPASGVLAFNINSSEKVRINSSGRVGIGTNNPQALLEVQDRSGGTLIGLSVGTQYGNAGFGGYNNYPAIMNNNASGNQPLIYCDTNNDRTIFFGDTVGFGTTCAFRVNGAERARIDSSGDFGIGMSPSGVRLDVYSSSAADIARFSGPNSAGLTIRNDTNNELQLHTAPNDALIFGTNGENERLRISSAGFVGINSAIPRTYLQVSKGSSGYNPGNPTAFNSNNVLACFENNDNVEVTLLSPNNKKNIINFGDTDNVANSSIEYDHSINHLLFKVNGGSERFRINNSGAFGLAGTNYGTAGQVLTSGGTNSVPTWTTPSSGLSHVQSWYLTTNGNTSSSNTDHVLPTDGGTWQKMSNATGVSAGTLGSDMTYDGSGVFAFPVTGIWKIEFYGYWGIGAGDSDHNLRSRIQTTVNNSSYTSVQEQVQSIKSDSTYTYQGWFQTYIFDVTNTSNCKCRFVLNPSGSNTYYKADGSPPKTGATFMRLGDT